MGIRESLIPMYFQKGGVRATPVVRWQQRCLPGLPYTP